MSTREASASAGPPVDLRVLILAPTGRDATLAERTLTRQGVPCLVCADLGRLGRAIADGGGIVLIADEALPRDAPPEDWIGAEPPWSSLPLVVLTGRTASPRRRRALRRLERRANVSFLERPVPRRTLVSTVRAALDARRRQLEIRDFLEEQARSARQRELLVRELNHRVKNTLAIVQALAQQTFRGLSEAAGPARAFESRLGALAAAHNLLTEANWERTSLEQVAAQTVAATCPRPERVRIAGPYVLLDPKKAVTLALAFHELSTNAIKHGALSTEAGTVDLVWTVADTPDRGLRLTWRERGGPTVSPPRRRGFGTRMIEQALAQELDGTVTLGFDPDGLTCTIEGKAPA